MDEERAYNLKKSGKFIRVIMTLTCALTFHVHVFRFAIHAKIVFGHTSEIANVGCLYFSDRKQRIRFGGCHFVFWMRLHQHAVVQPLETQWFTSSLDGAVNLRVVSNRNVWWNHQWVENRSVSRR